MKGGEYMEETNPQNNNMLVMGGIVVLILVLIGGFMFIQSRGTKTETAATQTQVTDEPTQTVTEEATQTISIEAGGFYFKPNVISVKQGEKVKIVVTFKDLMHDFNIDELDVHMPITKGGETNSVEFVADKAGTFEFYCSVGEHRKKGQVGTITINPKS